MADDTPPTDAPSDEQEQQEPEAPGVAADETEKWKALSRKNERELRKAQKELDDLRAATMTETERAIAEARAEGRAEALKTATERLLRAEVRSVAAGLMADPDDAPLLLDLSRYEAGEDLAFDRSQIKADIEALIKAKPYLSAAPGMGASEGGPRGGTSIPLNGDPLLADLKTKLNIP